MATATALCMTILQVNLLGRETAKRCKSKESKTKKLVYKAYKT